MRNEAEARACVLSRLRRRVGLVVVREMARHRWRHTQLVGLTRAQLTAIGREAPLQRIQAMRATRSTRTADHAIEVAQAYFRYFRPAFARLSQAERASPGGCSVRLEPV